MNFVPCKVVDEQGISIKFTDTLSLPVPPDRHERYRPHVGKDMTFGMRPEHMTEQRAHVNPGMVDFPVQVEVLEPMGVDTMVFFPLNGEDVCARSAPAAVRQVGEEMYLTADMSRMHLIDPDTNKVV